MRHKKKLTYALRARGNKMKQSKTKPIFSEKERQKRAVAMTYEQHQKQIDTAIEIALQNVHWIGLPDDFLSKVEGTKLIYPKDINHIHLRIGVREVTKNPENRLFGWFVTGFILNKHTNKLVMQSRWTRRDLQHVKILSQAMLFGTGVGDLQYEIKNNVLQGYKPCSDEDVDIVQMVWEEKMNTFTMNEVLEGATKSKEFDKVIITEEV